MRKFRKCTGIFLLIVVVFSCKKGVETNRYPLTDEMRNFLPYQQGDQISFQHSNGLIFNLDVVQKREFWEQTEMYHAGDNYSSYEVQEVKLASTEPELHIVFRLTPEQMTPVFTASLYNQPYYYYAFELPQFDSLTINGKTYENVFVLNRTYVSTGEITADSIFINHSHGLLKICMTNEETYTILP